MHELSTEDNCLEAKTVPDQYNLDIEKDRLKIVVSSLRCIPYNNIYKNHN